MSAKVIATNCASGHNHGLGRATVSKSIDIQDRYERGQMKRYNIVLSPIYENVAYLDLEHSFAENELGEEEIYNQSDEKDHNLPFQSYVERRQSKLHVTKRRHSDHFPKRRHLAIHSRDKGLRHCQKPSNLLFQAHIDQNLNKHHGSKRKAHGHQLNRTHSDVEQDDTGHAQRDKIFNNNAPEIIQLTEITSDNQSKAKTLKTLTVDGKVAVDGNTCFNKKPLHQTISDPTNDKKRTTPPSRDYVGYNIIEKFLQENSFDSELDVAKPKAIRSNSEPLVNVPKRLQNSLFIDAFDEKSKSLDDLNVNTNDGMYTKVKDKQSSEAVRRSALDFKPIEAYKEEKTVCKNKPESSSIVQQDDLVPTTSKGLTQSSLYQGHPLLDPTLLLEQSTPQGNRALPFELGHNSRRVKLTPIEQRRRNPCCPAERKLQKRCFLLFFIILVLAVGVFVLFNIEGWFDEPFMDLYRSKHRPRPTATKGPNITQVNSTHF